MDERRIVVRSCEALEINFPHVRTIIFVKRQSASRKKQTDWENSFYLSSHEAEKHTPEQWLQLIRNHWAGVEIRNHWRKDACLFEDKTRSRNSTLVGNLILLRNIVLHFFIENQENYPSLPAFIEAVGANAQLAFNLIKGHK